MVTKDVPLCRATTPLSLQFLSSCRPNPEASGLVQLQETPGHLPSYACPEGQCDLL